MIACPACGRENPDDARFCSWCATPLAPAAGTAREERKVVTVLFCDLVGFTGRAESMDPEDVRTFLSGYHERVRHELERHGGTVEKFVGDAVMALFGAPVAHEDDPERAVRAALAIRDDARDRGDLQVRIGITTGEALVSLDANPARGEGMASGDVVNTASRLQAAAPANGVLVDEPTYRATTHVIDYEDAPAVDAKGKAAPVESWLAGDPRARFGTDIGHEGLTPLVGRESELDLLSTALRRSRDERTAQLVTLVGSPGLGKSRLIRELFKIVGGDPELIVWRQGRSLPYGEGVAFWAIGEMVKAQAGILETDGAETADRKLARAVTDVIGDDADAEWVRSRLQPFVGSREREPTGDRREESFAAWRRFFEGLAEQNPLVLVFEDLQWADDGLLDFVDHLLDWSTGVPMLVVCAARGELLTRRPTWGGGTANATTVSLGALSAEETTRLVSRLLEQAVLPAELQSALVAKAGGNPLFAEEYVRMLQDRGFLVLKGGTWQLARTDELPLPDSVQATIAARLDALSTADKVLLQDAAVVGKVFWLGSLVALDGRDRSAAERSLRALVRRQLVHGVRRPSVEGESEFVFGHVLVRDVAYGQIPRPQRAEKHRRAAEWIESLGRPEDHAELVAHHYLSALEYARAAGQSTESLAAPARRAVVEAGDRATALNADVAAGRFYTEALALMPDNDPDGPRLRFRRARALHRGEGIGVEELDEVTDELVRAGERELAAEVAAMAEISFYELGERERAYEQLERALALVEGSPASRAKLTVLGALSRSEALSGNPEAAIPVGREAVEMASQLGLDELRANVLNTIGMARTQLGDSGGLEEMQESVEIARRINSPEVVRDLGNLSSFLLDLGELDRSNDLIDQAAFEAERFGNVSHLKWLSGERAVRAYLAGDWGPLFAEAEELLFREHFIDSACRGFRAKIHVARDEPSAAGAEARRALELARRGQDPQLLHPGLAVAAWTFASAGDRTAAGKLVDELLYEWELNSVLASAFWLVDLADTLVWLGRESDFDDVLARIRMRSPWVDGARQVAAGEFNAAGDIFAEIGSVSVEMYMRLRSRGEESVGPALEFYRSVGATRYVREGEALLARSA